MKSRPRFGTNPVPRIDPAPIAELEEAASLVSEFRTRAERVVLTNGCFDLLHAGHVAFLQACAALGDCLVVGLNDDASVTRLKGPGRPLLACRHRAEILAAIRWVGLVVPFSETTADRLLETIRPDVYAKGADYDVGSGGMPLPELETARRIGSVLRFIPLLPGASSSGLIIRASEIREAGSSD